jgi:hypothetical protein
MIDRFQQSANINKDPNLQGGVNSNVFQLGANAAKQFGQQGLQAAADLAKVAEARQKQDDALSAFNIGAKQSALMDAAFDEEVLKENDSDESFTERMKARLNTIHEGYENIEMTKGARDSANLYMAKLQAAASSKAFDTEREFSAIKRTADFKEGVAILAQQALVAGDTSKGLELAKAGIDLLDTMEVSPETRVKLENHMEGIALATARGVLDKDPAQLVKDIEDKLYTNYFSDPDTLSSLYRQALAEKSSRAHERNVLYAKETDAAVSAVKEFGREAIIKIPPIVHPSEEQRVEYGHEINEAIYFNESIKKIPVSTPRELKNVLEEYNTSITNGGLPLIQQQIRRNNLIELKQEVAKFYKALADDPISTVVSRDPQLATRLSGIQPYSAEYNNATKEAQLDVGVSPNDIRLTTADQLTTFGSNLGSTLKDMSKTDLDNIGNTSYTASNSDARMFLKQFIKERGDDGEGILKQIMQEMMRYSKTHNINTKQIISANYLSDTAMDMEAFNLGMLVSKTPNSTITQHLGTDQRNEVKGYVAAEPLFQGFLANMNTSNAGFLEYSGQYKELIEDAAAVYVIQGMGAVECCKESC